jgi:hypothetical protein
MCFNTIHVAVSRLKRTLVAGIAPSTRGKLTEYAEDVAVHYANKKREELLMAARDLMTADSVRYVLLERWFFFLSSSLPPLHSNGSSYMRDLLEYCQWVLDFFTQMPKNGLSRRAIK